MQKTTIADVEPTAPGGEDLDRRGLSAPLETDDVALNYYALDPGEAFSGGLHAHLDQEEVFYVMDGTATFETKPEATADSETIDVGAGGDSLRSRRVPAGTQRERRKGRCAGARCTERVHRKGACHSPVRSVARATCWRFK